MEHRFNRLMTLHLQLLRCIYKGRPIPLRYWLVFRWVVGRLFRFHDPLFPPHGSLRSTGALLQVPDLQKVLWDDVLGLWSLDQFTITLLWGRMKVDSPRTVIECGAGVSTLIFAKYASLCQPKFIDRSTVFSIEQGIQTKEALTERLVKLGLDDYVRILCAPISKDGRYELDTDTLQNLLGLVKADWLFIDGPVGPDGCRLWTLPLLAKFCRSGTRWFLDDSFRDGELRILKTWENMPGILVEGIYPVGKGLATGVVKDPQVVTMPLNS